MLIISRFLQLCFSALLLSSCASAPENRSNEYRDKVAQMPNDELCFQLAAHSSLDKWQIIRSVEVNRRNEATGSKICKEWLEAAKAGESQRKEFRVPSFYSPEPVTTSSGGVTQEQLNKALGNQSREMQRQKLNYDLINNWKPTYNSSPSRPYTAPAVRSAVPQY